MTCVTLWKNELVGTHGFFYDEHRTATSKSLLSVKREKIDFSSFSDWPSISIFFLYKIIINYTICSLLLFLAKQAHNGVTRGSFLSQTLPECLQWSMVVWERTWHEEEDRDTQSSTEIFVLSSHAHCQMGGYEGDRRHFQFGVLTRWVSSLFVIDQFYVIPTVKRKCTFSFFIWTYVLKSYGI